jgi:hypothetical protein
VSEESLVPQEYIEWVDAWLRILLDGRAPGREGGREGGRGGRGRVLCPGRPGKEGKKCQNAEMDQGKEN